LFNFSLIAKYSISFSPNVGDCKRPEANYLYLTHEPI
jgi:hypothetical protein